MRLIEKNGEVSPSTFYATLLNASCSALLLTNAKKGATIYLVVGKCNGETVFFPIDRSEPVSKYSCECAVSVSALVSGDLRNTGKNEVVSITSNGVLQSLSYPSGDPPFPSLLFTQRIYPNVCFAEIVDLNNDGLMEFLIAMTDRVVRSYRFSNEAQRLIPMKKWETPSHISACSVSFGSYKFSDKYAIFSHCGTNQYVQLDFGTENSIGVIPITYETNLEESQNTHLVVSSRPHSTSMFQFLCDKILVINKEKKTEFSLNCYESIVNCATTITLSSGLVVLVTVDPWGQMCIYGWNDNEQLQINGDPIAKCLVSNDINYLSGFPGPNDFSLIISIINIYNKIAIFLIDLSHIVSD